MDKADKRYKIADAIIEMLAREECTVDDATQILRYVAREICNSTTVQVKEKLAK